MTAPLVTQRELEGLLRRLAALEKRVAAVEVVEKSTYATGTYTPTYTGATTAGVTTYTTQTGTWVRIGSVMFVWGTVVWTAATGTGNAQISLPFAPTFTSTLGNFRSNNVTFAAGAPEPFTPGGAFLQLRSPTTNAATTPVAVEAAGDLIFSIAYFVG